MEKEENPLPNQSILLIPDKSIRKNYFQSQLLLEIKPQDVNEDKESNKLIKELEDILICCICYNYLEDPVNDPSCCSHYACKKCLDQYFKKLKQTAIPCPLCRKKMYKRNLVRIPLVESIKEILKDAQNNKLNIDSNGKIDDKCEVHPKNSIFDICLDCKKKMCPICTDERKKHEHHHLVNYERYIKLFYFFQENFSNIKQTIAERENNIKELNKLNKLLEQQKRGYLNLLNDISIKINQIYTQNQENINKNIAGSMQMIAKLRNFMSNIKLHVSSQFKESYNDIENLEEIEKEVKQRIDKLNYKYNKNEVSIMKDICNKKLVGLNEKSYLLTVNKKSFFDNFHMNCKIESDDKYSFGMELSEDKKMCTPYLDIKKIINHQTNNSSYIPIIEYGNKEILYLEPFEVNKQLYSYENTIPVEEMFNDKVTDIDIKLTILSLSLK